LNKIYSSRNISADLGVFNFHIFYIGMGN